MGCKKLFGVYLYRLMDNFNIVRIFGVFSYSFLVFWVILNLFGPFRSIFGVGLGSKKFQGLPIQFRVLMGCVFGSG